MRLILCALSLLSVAATYPKQIVPVSSDNGPVGLTQEESDCVVAAVPGPASATENWISLRFIRNAEQLGKTNIMVIQQNSLTPAEYLALEVDPPGLQIAADGSGVTHHTRTKYTVNTSILAPLAGCLSALTEAGAPILRVILGRGTPASGVYLKQLWQLVTTDNATYLQHRAAGRANRHE